MIIRRIAYWLEADVGHMLRNINTGELRESVSDEEMPDTWEEIEFVPEIPESERDYEQPVLKASPRRARRTRKTKKTEE